MDGASATAVVVSPATIEEWMLETGGGLAESYASGILLTNIPKSGSNSVSASFSWLVHQQQVPEPDLTDSLRARGLTTVNGVRYIYSADGSVGRPHPAG